MKHKAPVFTLALLGALALAALSGGLFPAGNPVYAVEPVFDDFSSRSVLENTPPGVNIGDPISATDMDEEDLEFGNTLTYSLEGTDAASFDIDASTGQLITKAALDMESKSSYSVMVRVDDGESRLTPIRRDVDIEVTNVNEPPAAPYPPTVVSGEDDDPANETEESTTSLKVVWHPPDNAGRPNITLPYGVEYKKSTETTFFTGDNPNTLNTTEAVVITGTTATITGLKADTSYDVRVQATNSDGTGSWSLVGTGSTNKANNAPPSFQFTVNNNCTDADICRAMPENQSSGQNIGTAIPSARDTNPGTKTYQLEGPDADFFVFDTSSRRIRTKQGVTYDHEAKDVYRVTVTVSDGQGATDAVRVRIGLNDVTEPPSAPPRPTIRPTEKLSTSLDVSWSAPDNTGRPRIDGYIVQYREGSKGAFVTTPALGNNETHTTMTSFTIDGGTDGLEPGKSYQVQVLARNAEGSGAESVVGTGSTSADNKEPEFDDGDQTITRYVDENTLRDTQAVRTVGARVAASDQDRDTLYYSLTDDADDNDDDNDEEFFTVDEKTGQIRTKSLLSHEKADCHVGSGTSTTCIYTVTVEVRDRKDGHRNDDKDEGADDTIAVRIDVRDENEPPAAPAVTVTSPGANTGTTLSVIWGVPDNTGPNISGYEVEHTPSGGSRVTQQISNADTTTATIEDLTANTSHQVRVRATTGSDEGEGAWSRTLTVYTNRADNNAPTLAATEALSVVENTGSGQNIGDPVVATDVDIETESDVVTYSLEGPHASLFAIDSRTGQIRTRAALNHEAICSTADGVGDGDHAENCTYSVMVKAVDRNRGSAASQETITVNDDPDEPPDEPARPTVTPTKDTSRSLDVSWSAPRNEGPPITGYDVQYWKDGGDFLDDNCGDTPGEGSCNGLGADATTTTISGLESGTDYQVRVRAISDEAAADEGWSDPAKRRTAQGNERPKFETSGPVTLTVVENLPAGRDVGSAISASDDDGSRNRLRYTLEGPGASSFTINAGTGQIRTKSPLDYESREFYSLTVKVDDGSRTDNSGVAKSVTVRVGNDTEPPSAPRAPRVSPVSGSTSSVRVTWEEPANMGPPIDSYHVEYRRADNRDGGFNRWPHHEDGVDRSTIITGLTAGTRYVVQVRAHNSDGSGPWSSPGSGAPNRDTANRNPAFSGGSRSLSVTENTPSNTDVGAPIAAIDQDGDPLRYSLEGPDAASFEIVSTGDGGQIRTVVELNHEEKSRYSITVRVRDGRGGSDAVTVTITVTDEPNETPSAPDAPTVTTVSSTSLQVSWEEPENQGPPITDYDYRYREASESSWTQITNTTITSTTLTIESLRPGTFYDVEVRARNDEGVSDWSIAGFETTAAPGANNPPVFREGASATRSVSASAPAGTNIGDPFTATDADEDDTLTYSLEGQDAASFDVGENTGQLVTVAGVTLAADSTYTVIVVASDGTDAARITVTIEATAAPPNNPPVFSEGASTTRSVSEDAAAGANIGSPVTATDTDQGDTLTYALGGADAASFTIAAASGQMRTSATLDYDTKASYTVTVTANDTARASDSITVTINVTQVVVADYDCSRGAVADQANTGLVADCEALLAARNTLEGSARLNWSVGNPIDQWEGVYLRGTPSRVTMLILRRRGLDGTVPADLGQLGRLTVLNLHSNALTGQIPSEIGNLTNLEQLLLHNNSLSGDFPDLRRLRDLTHLWLSGTNQRVGMGGGIPTWLNGLTNLVELNLWGNEMGGTIPNLSGLTSLKLLKLQYNSLTGSIPTWFGNMNSLGGLYLHRNDLTGSIPSELGQLTRLRRLWLDRNDLTGSIPPALGSMSNLGTLNLHTNRLSGSIPTELGNLSRLQHFALHNNALTGTIPTGLGNLSELTRIAVSNNRLTGTIPAGLGRLDKLTLLWLSQNQLTGTIPSALGDLGDTLTSLRLGAPEGSRGNTGLTGCVPRSLAGATDDGDLSRAGSAGLSICQ